MKINDIKNKLPKIFNGNKNEMTAKEVVQETIINPITDDNIEFTDEDIINQILEILSKCSPERRQNIVRVLDEEDLISSEILKESAFKAADSNEIPNAVAVAIVEKLQDEETVEILEETDLPPEARYAIINTLDDDAKREEEIYKELELSYKVMTEMQPQSVFIEKMEKIISDFDRTDKVNEELYRNIAKNCALMYQKTNGAVDIYAMEQLVPISEMIRVKMPERIEKEYEDLLEDEKANKFNLKDMKKRFIDRMVKEIHRKAKEEEQPDSAYMKYLGEVDDEQIEAIEECFRKYNKDITEEEMIKIIKIANGEEKEYIEEQANIGKEKDVNNEMVNIIKQCMNLGLFDNLRKIEPEKRQDVIQSINRSLVGVLERDKIKKKVEKSNIAKRQSVPKVKRAGSELEK